MQYNNFHDEPNNKSAVSSAPFWLMGLVSIISVITSIITAVNLPGFLTWVSVGIAAISTIAWFCVASLCNFVNNLNRKVNWVAADVERKRTRLNLHKDESSNPALKQNIWMCLHCCSVEQKKNSICTSCHNPTDAEDWKCPKCGAWVDKSDICPECHYELTDVNKNIKSSSQS